jgi:lysophospholipase L1-like esterase
LCALLALACGDAPPVAAQVAAAADEAAGARADGAAGDAGARLAAGGRTTFATLSHSCAVVAGGLQCWGASERGQTGDASLARRRPLPLRVPGVAGATAVAAGGSHTCGLAGGRVLCFGNNDQGQAGGARPFVRLKAAIVEGVPAPASAVAAGLQHSCAIAGGRVYCWGRNEQGEAGAPPPPGCREPFRVRRCSVAPVAVPGIAGARMLALGDRHGCASDGASVSCWGGNASGALGDATRESRFRAAPVRGLAGPVLGLAAGSEHSCAIAGGALFCWGAGRDTPRRVAGLPGDLRLVAAGGAQTCAAGASRAWCWRHPEDEPRAVEGLSGPLHALAVSPDHACALQGDAVLCWGENDSGQLGRGVGTLRAERAAPVAPWDQGVWRDANQDGRITLVCLGDSNTQAMPGAAAPWCDRLPPLLGADVQVVNRGEGGATAAPSLVDAASVVEHVVENDAPDLAVLWYGTNDVLAETPTAEIVAALARHDRALLAAGALSWVALAPPVRSGDPQLAGRVDALNDALRQAFPAERLLDFHAGISDADLRDRVHLRGEAQERIARRAAAAILRRRPEPAP